MRNHSSGVPSRLKIGQLMQLKERISVCCRRCPAGMHSCISFCMAAVCAIDTISFLQRIRRREPTLAQTYRRVSFKVPFMLGNPKFELHLWKEPKGGIAMDLIEPFRLCISPKPQNFKPSSHYPIIYVPVPTAIRIS